jgi:hypothetical protein
MKMNMSDEAWEGLQKTINELAEKAYPRSETQKLCQYMFRHPLQAIGPALWLVGRWSQMQCFKYKH